MRTELRLGSVVGHGVGGPEAAAIDMIYIQLLSEFGQDFYSRIGINQIDESLDEFVSKEPGNKIHVNIRFPSFEDFESKSVNEKNKIRLDVIHSALLRIAEYDKKLSVEKLELIKNKILEHNFSFDFICKSQINKRNPNLIGKVIIQPQMNRFVFYAIIEDVGNIKCKINLITARTAIFFGEDFFSQLKWKGNNILIIEGKRKELEIRIAIDKCKAEFLNLTPYPNPPLFTLMRVDVSENEREKAAKDWEHSLPPAIAAITRQANN